MNTPSSEFPNLSLIRQGVDFRFKVKLRAKEFVLRPLSVMEEDQITQEVVQEMSELQDIQKTSLRQSLLLSLKKLEAAQTSDVGANDPAVYAEELKRMTPAEIDYLFKEWNAGNDKLNPMIEKMPAKEVESWVEELKKNSKGRETMLIGLSFFQLVALCQHLLSTGELPEVS